MHYSFIGDGLKSEGVSLNVLNILRSLVEDRDSIVYIPQDYKRGSASSGYDSKVHALPSEAGKPIHVIGLSSNQERFNFSVLGLVDIMVEEDSVDGEVSLVPKKVFRQYTIVRDGNLTMEYIVAKLSAKSFTVLRDAGILYYNGVGVPKNHKHNPDFIYKIKLEGLPVVSCNWARPVVLGLYELMNTDNEVTQTLKVVKELISDYKEEGQFLPTVSSDVYQEKPDVPSKSTGEEYEANCVTYEFDDDDGNFVLPTKEFLRSTYPDIRVLEAYRKSLAELQTNTRFNSRCIIMAIENSKKKGGYDWSEPEKVPRSKNKMRQKCTFVIPDGSVRTLIRTQYTKKVKV